MPRKRILAPLVLGTAVAVLTLLLGQSPFIKKLELRFLDFAFEKREEAGSHAVPIHPDVRLILVDDETLDRIDEPIVFWGPRFADAMRGAFEGGATVVGLDYLLSYVDPKNDAAVIHFHEALAPYLDRVFLGAFMDEDPRTGKARLQLPADQYALQVGYDHVGLLNLTRDLDGVARAQQLAPLAYQDPTRGVASWSFLAPLLAERHTGRKVDAERLTFGEAPLPALARDDHRLLINFAGATDETFPSYPFWQVLERAQHHDAAWLRERFSGKAVIIGEGSHAGQDIVNTPFSARNVADGHSTLSRGGSGGASMLGAVVHASTLNTLLTGAWLHRATPLANGLLLLAVCLLAAFWTYRMSAVRGAFVALGLIAAMRLVTLTVFTQRGVWLDFATYLFALPVVWGLTYSYRYAAEERQRDFVQRMFGRYVSREVMEELLEDPGKLVIGGGKRQEVTIFFSDINGFTTVSESRPPEEVIPMLNAYLDEMTKIVFHHRGTVKQYVGDEIMLLYGAPREHPDPERAAIRTALDMVDRLDALRAADPDGTHGFYDIKIGIHTGKVVVGNIGSAERTEYTAIGDSVNLASRIMNMTKEVGGTILISENIHERVRDMEGVEFVYKDMREVRGRQSRIGIYEVRRAAGAVRSPDQTGGESVGHAASG